MARMIARALPTADYRTIAVTLGEPFISVDTPAPARRDGPAVGPGRGIADGQRGVPRHDPAEYQRSFPRYIYALPFPGSGLMELSIQVPVEQGKIAEVTATLQPKTGTLAVNSTPPGARVLLDGADAGISPVVLANISADNHTVTLEKDGYVTAAREVRITAGQVNPVEVSLDPVSVSPTKTRAAGLVPAMAGAFCVILLGVAYHRRHNR